MGKMLFKLCILYSFLLNPKVPTYFSSTTEWKLMLYAEYIGEGDGTPLQYSCLENPMDGGAW